tara:strand:+ start:114 stop:2564 length:2451 start_codon:yes stop_codon:yes gene_type:complete
MTMDKNNNQINKLISSVNNMKSFTITEKYDIVNAKKILMSEIVDDEYKCSLRKYFKHGKNGRIEIEYTQNEIGRLNIKVKNIKEGDTCVTQSLMWREAKSALCSKYYRDLDIVNAHPVILLQVFKSKGYECPILDKYVNNRESIFKEAYTNCKLSRDNVKTLTMRIFYGGSVSAFCKDNKIDQAKLPPIFNKLNQEMEYNTKELLNQNELIKYRMKAFEEKGSDYYNINGTAMAYFLQTLECKCLMTMYEYLQQEGIKVGALIHDGLHIEINDKIKSEVLCDNISSEIHDKTGFLLDLKIKPFQDIPELTNMIVVETDKEGGDHISDKIKNDYVMSQERIFMRVENVWTDNPKVINRNLIKVIGNMDIFLKKETINKEGEIDIKLFPHSTMKKGCMDMLAYVEPTEDPDFIENLWQSNLHKLCFKNGYYDFKKGQLVDYDNDTHTTIKINSDYGIANDKIIQQVYDKILNPIFNNDNELRDCWLNYIARGLAGHIEDKNWAVGIGERDCGKGVVGGMLENCFGEYCRSTNSENFLFKKGQADSAKALSWLVPFEFRRLLLTNEITVDAERKYRINGNTLKKLSSGGDKIEARVNHKDEINFKIQARVCMFCNDLPPIEPADTKETSYMFRYPSKFLNPDDPRLGKPIMRPVVKEIDGRVEYEYEDNGDKKMINVCNFYEKDDDIKTWCKKPEVMSAFINIIFSSYGDKAFIPKNMKEEMEDFKEEEKEEDKFLSLYNFMGDSGWVEGEDNDWVSINNINYLNKKNRIALSAQKYKGYLQAKGCYIGKRTTISGERVNAWINVQVNENKHYNSDEED